jgi:hypothetical protein
MCIFLTVYVGPYTGKKPLEVCAKICCDSLKIHAWSSLIIGHQACDADAAAAPASMYVSKTCWLCIFIFRSWRNDGESFWTATVISAGCSSRWTNCFQVPTPEGASRTNRQVSSDDNYSDAATIFQFSIFVSPFNCYVESVLSSLSVVYRNGCIQQSRVFRSWKSKGGHKCYRMHNNCFRFLCLSDGLDRSMSR